MIVSWYQIATYLKVDKGLTTEGEFDFVATIVVNKTASQLTGSIKTFKINDGLIGVLDYTQVILDLMQVLFVVNGILKNSVSTFHPLLLVKFWTDSTKVLTEKVSTSETP